MNKRIWLITGISSGLGKELAQTVMNKGEFVIGTFRNQSQVTEFNKQYEGSGIGIQMDITNPIEIKKTFDFVKLHFQKVDVLVNNAGYGLVGAVEEVNMEEARAVFEANFFGTFFLTQTFLPLFRNQGSGHIIQISSHGGVKASAGFGIYNASKFALEGLSEALAAELEPLGIKLTLVEPGPFRTKFAGSSLKEAQTTIDQYNATAGLFRSRLKQVDGKQEGDPVKAAQAIFEASLLNPAPLRLPLGKTALRSFNSKIASLQNDLNSFSTIAEKTVY